MHLSLKAEVYGCTVQFIILVEGELIVGGGWGRSKGLLPCMLREQRPAPLYE